MLGIVRSPQDFWTGIIFFLVGFISIIVGLGYDMGNAGHMGPAYFPTILGALLSMIGVTALIRSFIRVGTPIEQIKIKNLAVILAAVVLFGFLIRTAGLFIAVIALVLLSGYASKKFRFLPFLLLSVGMAVFSALTFVYGLGLPMPLFGSWFGN